MSERVAIRQVAPWGGLLSTVVRHAAPWGSGAPRGARQVVSWSLTVGVSARHLAPWSAPDQAPIFAGGETRLIHQGRVLPLLSEVQISIDSGSPSWLASLALTHAEDYARVALGDTLSLDLRGTVWALICDGRSFSRSGDDAAPSYTLSAISPVARLGSPWALAQTLGEGGMARAVVERLLGQAVDWRIVDWGLPEDAVSLEGSPLELARTLVAAVGGVLESEPNGSLVVRPSYPVSPPRWAGATARILTDRDLFAHSEEADASDIANRYTITSGSAGEAADAIQVESTQVPGDPHAYDVRAYPDPMRPIALGHTGDFATQVGARSALSETHSELIEILAGEGSVRYPVARILSVDYQHAGLGAVRADGQTLTASGKGYSLARVTYQTQGWQWRVTNARSETIQFLALES